MKTVSDISGRIETVRRKIRQSIDYVLGGSYDYYTCLYPGNTGIISGFIIKKIMTRIKLDRKDKNKLNTLNEKGIVVYAAKRKTLFDFLFFHTVMREKGLPYPEIGFDYRFILLQPLKRVFRTLIVTLDHFFHHFKGKNPYKTGYIEKELMKGRAALLFLIQRKAFYRRFVKSSPDPLHHLITLQRKLTYPVLIVPEAVVFGTKPTGKEEPGFFDIILGTSERPGIIKRFLMLLRNPGKISVEISEPVNLKEFLENYEISRLDTEFQTHKLRSYLVDIINRQRRSVTGPDIKSREEVTEDILTDRSLREYLADYASRNDQSLMQTHKKAANYIREIASNYNLRAIQLADLLLTWVIKNMFDGLVVDQAGLDKVKEKSKQGPLILIPCHKSHLDYLLIPYIMYKNKMPTPRIAAGKNLSFWPLGPIFRVSGAFFLRRTFRGAELYSKIFNAYIQKLLYEGFNIKIFIEGSRSRSGKLLSPKLGLLSMIFQAYAKNVCDNLFFVPVYIGYDRVIEEDAYLRELEGGSKSPENLGQLLKARKFLKKKYGKVYINFHEPISLKDYMQEKGVTRLRAGTDEYRDMVKQMGYKLINSISSISVVTPYGIMASAILNCYSNRFAKKELVQRTRTYMNFLTFFNVEMADTLTVDPDSSLDYVINVFLSRNFIELADEDEKELSDTTYLIVKDNKRPILDYYKNNAIYFFIPAAYTAAAIIEQDRIQFVPQDLVARYRFFEHLFIDEFSFDENTSSFQHIENCFRAFMEEGIIVPDKNSPDAYNLTSSGLKKLKHFSSFLLPFLESFKIVLYYFKKTGQNKLDGKDRIKKVQSIGARMYKRRNVALKESLSKINLTNTVNFCLENGIEGREDMEKIDYYNEAVEKFLLLLTA